LQTMRAWCMLALNRQQPDQLRAHTNAVCKPMFVEKWLQTMRAWCHITFRLSLTCHL
jgi:hypothetical protein